MQACFCPIRICSFTTMLWSLPNLFTLINLLLGCSGIYFVFHQEPTLAIIAIGGSLLMDFLDGTIARAMHVSHPVGVELDSLADVISFGVLPSSMLLVLLQQSELDNIHPWLPLVAFIFAGMGAMRLAKFNIDERPSHHFYGLPIPAAAIYLAGLYWSSISSGDGLFWIFNPYFLLLSLLSLSYLMLSNIPHFHFKVQSLGWRGQEIKWIYLVVVLVAILLFRELGISIAIVLYTLFSWLTVSMEKNKSANQ